MILAADRFAQSAPARRSAALALLALLAWILAPFVVAPFASLGERREAIASDAALLDRLSRIQARRAEIARLASRADAPFFVALDATEALDRLAARGAGAVPAGAMRIEAQSALPREEKPGAPVELSISFTATEEALHGFLVDLETRPPFVRVRELALKPLLDAAGTRLLSGHAVLSAVPFLRAAPK